MRLAEYGRGRLRSQQTLLWLSRRLGAELDDVAKVSMRRPDFFGRPFLHLAHTALRGPSSWSVGERELFAAVVSRANSCTFCVGTHAEIAGAALGHTTIDDNWQDGRFGPRATASARFLDSLTREPGRVKSADLAAARSAGVADAALAEAVYIAFTLNVANRLAHALEFGHRSDRDRKRGAWILRHNGYRLPRILLR